MSTPDPQAQLPASTPVPGSERKPFSQQSPATKFASHVAPATADEPITVVLVLARREPIDPATFQPGRHLTREQFAQRHAPTPETIADVQAFAKERGLRVTSLPAAGHRSIKLTGTLQQVQQAFGVTLHHHTVDGRRIRTREGSVYLPKTLAAKVEAVLGLDNRPQARPHFRIATPRAGNTSFTPVQVGNLYQFPASVSASAQTIALIELGGGFQQSDVTAYFESISVPAPKVTAVSVDSATNAPGDPNGADGEVMLDIEVVGAIARGADLAVYFAPNTDAGFLDAITTAIHDATNAPSVVSISWGGPESTWTQQAMTAMDDAFQAAASLGITVTVAAGDNGSSDGETDGANHVDFPASSPHVLACGGTKLVASGGTISSEVVWNEEALNEGATGGGVSTVFAKPAYQSKASVPAPPNGTGGRGVPDVAGDADPSTGYVVRVDGQTSVIGGTSAVAPLWAGLIALANAANGSNAGLANTALYNAEASAFRDITAGNNGAFAATKGWDACTGLGSPIGTAVITALKA